MIEKLVAATGIRIPGALHSGLSDSGEWEAGVRDDDLPCPWCHGPTSEFDPRCPSCGRRFG